MSTSQNTAKTHQNIPLMNLSLSLNISLIFNYYLQPDPFSKKILI